MASTTLDHAVPTTARPFNGVELNKPWVMSFGGPDCTLQAAFNVPPVKVEAMVVGDPVDFEVAALRRALSEICESKHLVASLDKEPLQLDANQRFRSLSRERQLNVSAQLVAHGKHNHQLHIAENADGVSWTLKKL